MTDGITILISTGTAIIVTLIGAIKILWETNKKLVQEHKEDRKDWIETMSHILGKQNEMVKEVSGNHDKALKELAEKYDKRQGEINDTMLAAFKTAFNQK